MIRVETAVNKVLEQSFINMPSEDDKKDIEQAYKDIINELRKKNTNKEKVMSRMEDAGVHAGLRTRIESLHLVRDIMIVRKEIEVYGAKIVDIYNKKR